MPIVGSKHVKRSIDDDHVEQPRRLMLADVGHHGLDLQTFGRGLLQQLPNAGWRQVNRHHPVAQPRDEQGVPPLPATNVQHPGSFLVEGLEKTDKFIRGQAQRVGRLLVNFFVVGSHSTALCHNLFRMAK